GQRSRHGCRDQRAHLQAVLHLEGERHGPRARDHPQAPRRARRHDRSDLGAEPGHRVQPGVPAPGAGAGGAVVSPRILIVEDEKAIQLALRGLLRRDGYDVDLADTGEDAVRKLGEVQYDLVLTDLALGRGLSGMDVLRASKDARPETAVVMITAHGNEKVAVEAMKQGAEDYLPKPFHNAKLRMLAPPPPTPTHLLPPH